MARPEQLHAEAVHTIEHAIKTMGEALVDIKRFAPKEQKFAATCPTCIRNIAEKLRDELWQNYGTNLSEEMCALTVKLVLEGMDEQRKKGGIHHG